MYRKEAIVAGDYHHLIIQRMSAGCRCDDEEMNRWGKNNKGERRNKERAKE